MPESPIEQFQAFLKQRGLRLTPERRAIAEIVIKLAPPIDLEALLGAVEEASFHISRSTIYRTLSLLVISGLLRKRLPTHPTKSPNEEAPSSLCATTHSNLLAGKCPWCGKDIIQGNPQGPADLGLLFR